MKKRKVFLIKLLFIEIFGTNTKRIYKCQILCFPVYVVAIYNGSSPYILFSEK